MEERILVLVRHGESEWNKLNLFTGWTDVDLSETGVNEAKNAGKLMKEAGYDFDVCYTSYLKRAIHTLNYALNFGVTVDYFFEMALFRLFYLQIYIILYLP